MRPKLVTVGGSKYYVSSFKLHGAIAYTAY